MYVAIYYGLVEARISSILDLPVYMDDRKNAVNSPDAV